MKSNKLGNIKVSTPSTKKAKFNLSHDVNTTYDWGSIQPLMGKFLLPDSSINVNMEQLTRLAPMVVPTFGRVKMKNVAHFVPIKEIFPNWEYFLAKQQISRPTSTGTTAFVPNAVPHINSNVLTALALAGAKVNWYVSGATNQEGINNINTWRSFKNTGNWGTIEGNETAIEAGRALLSYFFDRNSMQNIQNPPTKYNPDLNYTGYTYSVFNLINKMNGTNVERGFFDIPTISTINRVPLNGINTFTHSANGEQGDYGETPGQVTDFVTMDEADIIWESDTITSEKRTSTQSIWNNFNNDFFDGCKVRFCFKLSSFGKRLRKILIGLGYNFSLSDTSEVSILPLLAFYKAWWDTYAPEREKNFYMTNAWKIIQFCEDSNNNCDLNTVVNSNDWTEIKSILKTFIFELGTLFATEKIDAISAATDKMFMESVGGNVGSSQGVYEIINEVLDDFNANYINAVDHPEAMRIAGDTENTGMVPTLGNSSGANYTSLTQPQLDALKKAYTYINKYSVAGKQIAEILRMNGLGKYVEECIGKFISSDESTIKISDVVATAGTDENPLGDYGGRGLGLGNGQMSFNTDKHGYFIILSCIVPEAGYVNAPDMINEAVYFDDIYNPEFDGMSYEAVEKKQIAGSPVVNSLDYNGGLNGTFQGNNTFGYLPTYSNWKFCSNKANGDFSLNSMKTSLRPYTLDKYIPVEDVSVRTIIDDANPDTNTTYTYVSPTFKYSDLPNAGEDYRYVNKMSWNGNYNRIFKAEDDGIDWVNFSLNNNAYLYNGFEYDNFLVHNVLNITYWAPMKAIEDSYSTYDEDDNENRSSIRRS